MSVTDSTCFMITESSDGTRPADLVFDPTSAC